MRKFFVDQGKKAVQISYFGSQSQNISKEASEYIEFNKEKITIIKLDDIRKYKLLNTNENQVSKVAIITQAGNYFLSELNSLKSKADDIHISISLEVINVINFIRKII